MIKKLLYCYLLFSGAITNAQITFQKAYGGNASESGSSVKQTFDNGYIVAGTTTSFGSGGRDILVLRINSIGDTIWTRTFGGATDNEYGFCVQQTPDTGFIVSGVASSFNDVSGDMYLIKLDQSGDTMWTRTYGGNGYEWGTSVQLTRDSGYILTGQTPAFGAGGFDTYVVKVNSTGDLMWTKTYGGLGLEIGSDIKQTNDGGFIITGQMDSYGTGDGDIYLIKTDSIGNVIRTKVIGILGEDVGLSVNQTTDGGYILGGNSTSSTTLSRDICLLKINSTGNLEWSKTYGGSLIDEIKEVVQTADGGFILCGRSFSFSAASDYDVYVIKTDDMGNHQWSRTYGASGSGTLNDYGNSIQQTRDLGYIITGETFSYGVGFINLFLIKTDSLGDSGCNQGLPATQLANYTPQIISAPTIVSSGGNLFHPSTLVNSGTEITDLCLSNNVIEIVNTSSLTIFPNPVYHQTTLEFSLENDGKIEIELFNMTGSKVLTISSEVFQKGINSLPIDLSNVSPGIYFCSVKSNNYSKTIKISKQ